MKKILSILLLTVSYLGVFAQGDTPRGLPVVSNPAAANYNKGRITDANLKVLLTFGIPSGPSFTHNNSTPQKGNVFYNTTSNQFGVWNGTLWETFGNPDLSNYYNKTETQVLLGDSLSKYMKIADGLTRLDSIKVSGLTVTAYAPITWRINGLVYQKLTNSVFNVPAATDGYNRIDLLYATTSNTVLRLQGTETTGIAVAPVLPINTVSVALLYISGSVIQPPFPDLTGFLTREMGDMYYIQASPANQQFANIKLGGNGLTSGRIEATRVNAVLGQFSGGLSFDDSHQIATLIGDDLKLGQNTAIVEAAGFKLTNTSGVGFFHSYYSSYSEFSEQLNVNSFFVKTTPTLDALPTQLLTRDATTGEVKYVSSTSFGGGGGGGSVTSVSSANSDISVATGTTTPVLTLNSGTGANQIVKRDGSGNIADLANYYLASNPNGYISSYTETDPLFDTKFAGKTTTGLAEGTNLYYTTARFNTAFSGKSTTDLTEGTNLYFTQGRVSANTDVTANTAARHNAVTIGTSNGLSLVGQALSLGLASSGVTGALSGTDWTNFNGKQAQLNGTGFVKASGTTISYDNTSYYPASNPNNYTTLPTLTNGSVVFSNGTTLTQDNANFFWDDTNNRLGIGTATPAYALDLSQSGANALARFSTSGPAASIRLNNTATNGHEYNFGSEDNGQYFIYDETAGRYNLRIDANGKWFMGISGQPINIPNLGASQAVFTDASMNLVSKAANGTGNVILSAGTLNLVTGSTLNTAGAFATTLTSTAATNATLPAGTNTLYSTLANSITSAQMASSVTNESGTGALLFGTSPTIATPSLTWAQSTKTAAYTVVLADYFLAGDATTASFIMTLPTAASASGKMYSFKKIDSSANTVTIKGNGAELIDGTNTKVISTQYNGFTLMSNGTVWYILL